jgi:hypothetical protein
MYTKIPLNGIRNALGQEAIHVGFFIILIYLMVVYNLYTWLNFTLLFMHVFAYIAIYLQYTYDGFSMHMRHAVQMLAALFVIVMMAFCS